jgi:hypothetical protein
MNRSVHIFGGGTISHIASHLALCAPAYGSTARKLMYEAKHILNKMDIYCHLTKMADNTSTIETNEDLSDKVEEIICDPVTRVVIMSCAICDFHVVDGMTGEALDGKHKFRLSSDNGTRLNLEPANKIISKIRHKRKDIFLVGFKTTCGATSEEQYIAGLKLCKKASCNLVLANDVQTRLNMIVTPEESRYSVTKDRETVLTDLLEMVYHRTHLNFTRSTVVDGNPVSWESAEIPYSLKLIVQYLINNNAYKPFNGSTAGHFAVKLSPCEFLTSIRKTNFNELYKTGLVRVKTDGPDNVIAYGAKPSVGGQSQRIVFDEHNEMDCIVHFHCPIKAGSIAPIVSQREFECGSHECGKNTSNGLKQFGNLKAVYLDQHGPNIVFNKSINPNEVIEFIANNFDLNLKTGGFVSLNDRLNTKNTLEMAESIL